MVNTAANFSVSETVAEQDDETTLELNGIPSQIKSDDELIILSRELGVPEENIILDDEGNVVRIIAEDGTIIDSDTDDVEIEKLKASGEQEDKGTEGENKGTTEEIVNDLDFILKSVGIVKNTIDLEGGEVKNIGELSKEEQLKEIAYLVNEFKERADQGNNLDITKVLTEQEIDLVNYLRGEGKTIKTLIKDLEELSPSSQISKLSDEDLVRFAIKKERPGYTPEEVEAEVADLKSRNKIEREAKHYRTVLGEDEDPVKALTKLTEQERLAEIQQAIAQVNSVVEISKNTKEIIKGFTLDDSVRQRVMEYVTPPRLKDGDLSVDPPIIELMTRPEGIFELAYYKVEIPRIIQAFVNYAKDEYKRGIDETLGKLPPR